VRYGVPEVEHRSHARLSLIARHHLRLDLHAAAHHALEQRQVAGCHRPVFAFEQLEVLGVGDHAVLQRLGHSGRELHRRQCAQDIEVGEDQARLVERAQQILAGWRIHARFAAD